MDGLAYFNRPAEVKWLREWKVQRCTVSAGLADDFYFVARLEGSVDGTSFDSISELVILYLRKLSTQTRLDEHQMILDLDDLEYISVDSRQRIYKTIMASVKLSHVWCYAHSRWTRSFWRVVQLLVPEKKLGLVQSIEDAIHKARKTSEEHHLPTHTVFSNFDRFWRQCLHTRVFDNYVLRYVQLPEWRMVKEEAHFEADFLWVEATVLYVQVKGQFCPKYIDEFWDLQQLVTRFIHAQGLRELRLLTDVSGITLGNSAAVLSLKNSDTQAPLPVYRFVFGSSFVDKFRIRVLARIKHKKVNKLHLVSSLREGLFLAKNKQYNGLGNRFESVEEKEKYLQYLLRKKANLYKHDERLRRKLFALLGRIISGDIEEVKAESFSHTYLGAEIFHALELVSSDLEHTYKQLENEENSLIKLRSKALQQQLNPHFFFNSLNSIMGYLYQNKYDEADNLLTSFAQLMRLTIDNSQLDSIPLADEIDFLGKYIVLERMRTNNSFNYEIHVQPELKRSLFQYRVPPMIIQPMVERAIWKRLAPSQENGQLHLFFYRDNEQLICKITDNGTNEDVSESQLQSSSQRRLDERIHLLNSQKPERVHIRREDVYEQHKRLGKQVFIRFIISD